MKTALIPIEVFNPLVESPKVGFCVAVADRFVCAYEDREGDAYTMWRGGKIGYCRAGGRVRVWPGWRSAHELAIMVNGRVTTPPRIIGETSRGPVRVWEDANG